MVRKIKDRQFHASVKAGLGILILFPLIHGLQTLLVGIFTGPWWIWVLYMVSLFPLGKMALWWYGRWKKTVRGAWFSLGTGGVTERDYRGDRQAGYTLTFCVQIGFQEGFRGHYRKPGQFIVFDISGYNYAYIRN